MRAVAEFLSIVLFFVVYWATKDIVVATTVAVAIGVVQLAFLLLGRKKPDVKQLLSLILVIVLGGVTIWLGDERFIMWKPTVLFWTFALVIGFMQLLGKNPIAKVMPKVTLPAAVWARLSWAWAAFFAVMGALNVAVAAYFSTDVWVNYKMFGSTALIFIFMIAQTLYLNRFLVKCPNQHQPEAPNQ